MANVHELPPTESHAPTTAQSARAVGSPPLSESDSTGQLLASSLAGPPSRSRISFQLTRSWVFLTPILIGLLLVAINYDNNLIYFTLFLMVSIAVVSSVHTFRNLQRLEVRAGHVWPVFAGGSLRFNLQVTNPTDHPAYAIDFRHEDLELGGSGVSIPVVPAKGGETVEFILEARNRGRFRIDSILVSSVFPLGLLRAQREERLGLKYIVYPEPRGNCPWPETETDFRTQDDGDRPGGDDYYGVRGYIPGESQRHVDWKAVARGRPLMVKEFRGGGTGRVWFDWKHLEGLETEARLCQLSRWVVDADGRGRPYGVRLSGQEFYPATGPQHYHKVLSALANYRQNS